MSAISIDEATRHQAPARAALAAALERPSHAYLLSGPTGSGKRAAARAFAAEILAAEAEHPDEARRRALLDPSPHPDLVWVRPPGTQHLVEEIRERVISQTAYRPFEGERRVFVVEAAEAMADESQNALLKTLEEPPEFVHLVLLSAEPAALLETVVSRCRRIQFSPLPSEAIEERLAEMTDAEPAERLAASRLSGGDFGAAEHLVSTSGRRLRTAVEESVRAARSGAVGEGPWRELLANAEAAGAEAAELVEEAMLADAEAGGDRKAKARARKAASEGAKRAGRRRRTEVLDLALSLCAMWVRDLAAEAEGVGGLAYNADRTGELAGLADGLDPIAARKAGELVMDARARLRVNVSEELALESLFFALEDLLSAG